MHSWMRDLDPGDDYNDDDDDDDEYGGGGVNPVFCSRLVDLPYDEGALHSFQRQPM